MRRPIDILNYFSRSLRRKIIREQDKVIQLQRIKIHALQTNKDWQKMYGRLIEVLQNVPKYCALREPEKMVAPYPLERFEMGQYMPLTLPLDNPAIQYSHSENMYNAKCIILDYVIEDLIHFEIDTAEGRFYYQYSKQGLMIQPLRQIQERVVRMLSFAWYKRIHEKEK